MTFVRTRFAGRKLSLTFEGEPIEAREGDSVAAAIMAAGADRIRTAPKSGQPRMPYCLMGVCFECTVEIDGQPGQQSCLIEVRDGMRVRRQDAGGVQP